MTKRDIIKNITDELKDYDDDDEIYHTIFSTMGASEHVDTVRITSIEVLRSSSSGKLVLIID